MLYFLLCKAALYTIYSEESCTNSFFESEWNEFADHRMEKLSNPVVPNLTKNFPALRIETNRENTKQLSGIEMEEKISQAISNTFDDSENTCFADFQNTDQSGIKETEYLTSQFQYSTFSNDFNASNGLIHNINLKFFTDLQSFSKLTKSEVKNWPLLGSTNKRELQLNLQVWDFLNEILNFMNIKIEPETYGKNDLILDLKGSTIIFNTQYNIITSDNNEMRYSFFNNIHDLKEIKVFIDLYDLITTEDILHYLIKPLLKQSDALQEFIEYHFKLCGEDIYYDGLKYFIFKKLCEVEEGLDTFMLHFSFLYNVCKEQKNPTNLLFTLFLMKLTFNDKKVANFDKEGCRNYLMLYTLTIDSQVDVSLLHSEHPLFEYFYITRFNLQAQGETKEAADLIMNFTSMTLLNNQQLLNFKGSLEEFEHLISKDKNICLLFKRMFMVSNHLFLKNKLNF